jgi:lipoate-protein ligase A
MKDTGRNPSTDTWRLIWSDPLPAADNMAVDQAIFEQVAAGLQPPTLRIYAWVPPGVSVGFFQSLDRGINLEAVARYGYGLVRRPTGGRAILHHHEVTYSFCIPVAQVQAGNSVIASYRTISRGVEAGLTLLGVPAAIPGERHAAAKGRDLPTVCFAKAAGGDMLVEGRKIVGSAQMRRDGCILQHGSIPIRIDLAEHLELLGAAGADSEREQAALRQAAVGVAEVLGRDVSFAELGQAVVRGFSEAFGKSLPSCQLTQEEKARTAQLVETVYGTEEWNQRPGKRR